MAFHNILIHTEPPLIELSLLPCSQRTESKVKHTYKTSQVSPQNIPEHIQSLPAHTGLVVFAFSEIKIPADVINYPLHVIKLLLLRQQTHNF